MLTIVTFKLIATACMQVHLQCHLAIIQVLCCIQTVLCSLLAYNLIMNMVVKQCILTTETTLMTIPT